MASAASSEAVLQKSGTKIPPISVHEKCVISVLGDNPGPFTLQGTNTYLVGTGKSRILIDTGEGRPKYLESLAKAMEENGIDSIQEILLTHHHFDHIGGVVDVINQFGKIKVSKMHVDFDFGGADGSNDKSLRMLSTLEEKFDISPISDGQVFETEGIRLTAIHTPGHCDDHMSFLMECPSSCCSKQRSILSGDCILGEGTAVFTDLYDYMTSLQKLLDVGDIFRIYPAHGPIIDNPRERITAYIKHRNLREQQILETMKHDGKPLASMELTKIIYKKTPIHLHPAADRNVKLHLGKLKKEGKVEVDAHDDKLWKIAASNL